MIPIQLDQRHHQDMYAAEAAAEDNVVVCPEDQDVLKRLGRDQREVTIKMNYFLWMTILVVQGSTIPTLIAHGNKNAMDNVKKKNKQQKQTMNQKTMVHLLRQNRYDDADQVQELHLRATPTMWIRVSLDHQLEKE